MKWSTIHNKMKRSPVQSILILLLVTLLLVVSGCNNSSKKQSAIIPEEETIAVINNKKITLARFQQQLHFFIQQYRELITVDEKQLDEIKEIVINQLIDDELMAQEASRKGIHVSREEVETIMAESLSSYEQSNFAMILKASDLKEEEWKALLQRYLVQKKLVQEEVIDKIPITKREIRSYYQKHSAEMVRPQAIKVRNITLSTEEEADAIRSQLLRGKNFKQLIRQHSISPDKVLDGDLGYISRGEFPEEMESEIFKKKFIRFKPSYTEVIRSQDGFHVLKLEKYRSYKRLTLEQTKPKIKQILLEEKWNHYYTTWLEKLRKRATISIDRAMLKREEGF